MLKLSTCLLGGNVAPPSPCYQHQCQNNATCVPNSSNYTYTCICHQENSGVFCELNKVHGGWAEWTQFTECSQTCQGQQVRFRFCNKPVALNGGELCVGYGFETQSCGENVCPVDGEWGGWSNWSSCSATCHGGERTRTRVCDNPAPQHGGKSCSGTFSEKAMCALVDCPVHGGWGSWSTWSSCSVTCGDGTQSRERTCDSPAPSSEGQPCQGSSNQTQLCNMGVCPVCSELREMNGTDFNCSEAESPYLKTCQVVCQPGYSTANPAVYTCGQTTGYLWNFQRENATEITNAIQQCSPIRTPTTAAFATSVPLSRAACNLTAEVQEQVSDNMKNLPCVQSNNCQLKVLTSCNFPIASPLVSSRISSSSSSSSSSSGSLGHVVVSVDLKAEFGQSITLVGSDKSTLNKFVDVFTSVEKTATMIAFNDTKNLFTIKLDSFTIVPDGTPLVITTVLGCPPGTMQSLNGGCVDCPAGFYETGDRCVVCPIGQYQDKPASTSCIPCPWGSTWDSPGATDPSQCDITEPKTTVPPIEQEESDNTVLIAACVGGGLAAIAVIIVIIVVLCHLIRAKRNMPPPQSQPETQMFHSEAHGRQRTPNMPPPQRAPEMQMLHNEAYKRTRAQNMASPQWIPEMQTINNRAFERRWEELN